jgi:photosystem II stability/assembly factor-like uncharacterized protein
MVKVCQILILMLLFCFASSIGAEWKKVNSGSFAWFHSLYFVNQNKGWIVGSRGAFLETTDGGSTWKTKQTFTRDTIRDVYFADEQHGWVLCEKDVFSRGESSPSSILETFDGGETWRRVNFQDEGSERLVKLFFSKDGFGYAVGEAGTFYAMQGDKTVWKKNSLPIRFLLLDGSFFNQNKGLVVGGGGSALFTEDGGLTWNNANFAAQAKSKLNSVFFINQNVGWTVGAEGRIFTTVNGGKFWRGQNSRISQDLFDVFFLDTAEGWAVGDNGIVLHTTTAGNVWTPVQIAARHRLERVFFIGKKGFAVGFGGTILRYDSGRSDDSLSQQL